MVAMDDDLIDAYKRACIGIGFNGGSGMDDEVTLFYRPTLWERLRGRDGREATYVGSGTVWHSKRSGKRVCTRVEYIITGGVAHINSFSYGSSA